MHHAERLHSNDGAAQACGVTVVTNLCCQIKWPDPLVVAESSDMKLCSIVACVYFEAAVRE